MGEDSVPDKEDRRANCVGNCQTIKMVPMLIVIDNLHIKPRGGVA